ncbi:MAG: pyruvate:ferredoxin (flavodoxin) oxidoreductase [Bacteroidales bacterium]|nr:pyruvate:ferredoxin (flavodoxin) oxidoreductase [Bacteroidales bacterium]
MSKKKFITCDGNHAAAHVAYMFSEVAAIYPITPSSNMAENVDEWATEGRKNIFGETVQVVEMQSEGGAAGAVHGSLQAGALTSTFTASQGLLLMIPNMYKIAGELLPGVFHVSARSLAAQALSIFGDHSDVMSARQTGFAFLATGSVQEVMDLAPVAHLAAIKSRIPFTHFFDGFRTSHEIQKVEYFDNDDIADLVDQKALQAFRDKALNPENPVTRGTAQNPDVYFQAREAQNKFYDAVPDIVEDYMKEISKRSGREYHPFTYYGAADAENIIVAMGSVTDVIKETIDYLNDKGEKVGLISVHLYRPFSSKYFFNVLPKSVKKIAVLDRTKEPGANGEPLYLDVVEMFYNEAVKPVIVGGRYGLSSKDTTPAHIIAVYNNLKNNEPKHGFVVSIVDDVTNKSLEHVDEISLSHEGTFEGKFYGLGSDGTVGANKNSIKIIGDTTDLYAQAYFAYDSKKSGGFTASHLRFGKEPIRSPYLVGTPNFVACHVPAYLTQYDMLKGIKENGTFLMNSPWDVETTKENLPDFIKEILAKQNISMYIIDASKIANEIGLGNRTNTILQSAFFKIADIIPYDQAVEQMKKFIVKSYGKKGEKVISMNYAAVDRGGEITKVEIPAEWKDIHTKGFKIVRTKEVPSIISDFCDPINAQTGDDLPVSAFNGMEDGTLPPGTSKYEKRGVATHIPQWIDQNCIQCNQCSYVCPHAAIRPFLLNEEEVANAPAEMATLTGLAKTKDFQFRIQVSPFDCTGCGVCVDVCPSKEKSLVMADLLERKEIESPRWDYLNDVVGYKDDVVPKDQNVKNTQFAQPLFEFSGACAGCGETPYIKTATQLFGEQMTIANATGCSSIYGGSNPATPYTTHQESGFGPAWANSLFEDNAEFGYGMNLGITKLRDRIADRMERAMKEGISDELKAGFQDWLDNIHSTLETSRVAKYLKPLLEKSDNPLVKEIANLKQFLVKKSNWIIGGDGWAYDIGYGGLDHVLATGADVNILVLDTEVYSNTGGQSSKASQIGSVAKFAAAGKRVGKKDLGMIAAAYGHVYVASVAMGANQNQYLKAIKEAEAYPGPSIIIAYAPCIAHGIKGGMSQTMTTEKMAVEAGYWTLFRYNPMLEKEGKNPFVIDSKEPDFDNYIDFIKGETRYSSLAKIVGADKANEIFNASKESAEWRYKQYKLKAAQDYSME